MKRNAAEGIDDRRSLLCYARYGLAGVCALLAVQYAWAQARQAQLPEPPLVSQSANGPRLGLPIDCAVGVECHVLAYVDHDPGPGFVDFAGGRQTYDGHDGTDFAVADAAAMKRGVAVRAVAAGTVVRVRDGVPDKRVRNAQQARDVSKIGCGNFVLIDHAAGWRTYYCHLRNASVDVKPGMPVDQGTVLGMVGSSGLASYPHVHLGIQHQGQAVDPFRTQVAAPDGRHVAGSLWGASIRYLSAGLIDAGFSGRAVDIDSVWDGGASFPAPGNGSKSIVFWVHPFGVLGGDVETLRLIAPDGKTANETIATLKSSNRINRVSSIALVKPREDALRSGVWQGEYQLRRGATLLIDSRKAITVEEDQ